MKYPKENRIRSRNHRFFIASLPCVKTGLEGQSQCAHISYGRYSQSKSGDNNCIPLSWREHDKQTKKGELAYWGDEETIEIMRQLANELYKNSGDYDLCYSLIMEFNAFLC